MKHRKCRRISQDENIRAKTRMWKEFPALRSPVSTEPSIHVAYLLDEFFDRFVYFPWFKLLSRIILRTVTIGVSNYSFKQF